MKMGYIDDPETSTANVGYRDYNCDDVRDLGGNAYAVRDPDGDIMSLGGNVGTGRAPYYADLCEMRTDEH